jgi:nucleoside-diphosphate-sugar epimerase
MKIPNFACVALLVGALTVLEGAIRIVGNGENRWPMVHVDDLADLYVLAPGAVAGSLYFAAAGPSIAVGDIARAAAHGAKHGATIDSIPIEEAREPWDRSPTRSCSIRWYQRERPPASWAGARKPSSILEDLG